MPIHFYPTSLHRLQAFQAGLQQLVELGRIPADLQVYPYTFPVYNLAVPNILAKEDLRTAARLVSWRYFAGDDASGVFVAGDVDVSSAPQVTAFAMGASVRAAVQAAMTLERYQELKTHSYELRLLRISGLLTESLWLKPVSAGEEEDRLLPYHTLLKSVDRVTLYKVPDFFGILHSIANKVIRTNDSPRAVPVKERFEPGPNLEVR